MKFTSVLLLIISLVQAEELFVEELGESSEFIPIEPEEVPEVRFKRELTFAQRAQPEDYYNDYTEEIEEESSGDFDDSYDVDDDSYGGTGSDDEIMPSRPRHIASDVVSPSFQDPGFGNVVLNKMSTPAASSASGGAFDVIKTSLYGSPPEDVEVEGSGNADDYDDVIVPTKMVTTTPITPTFDKTTGNTVIDTSPPIVASPPVVQKRLKTEVVIAGRSLKIQIPEETFYDVQDGNTRQMKVDVKQENGAPLRVSLVVFSITYLFKPNCFVL